MNGDNGAGPSSTALHVKANHRSSGANPKTFAGKLRFPVTAFLSRWSWTTSSSFRQPSLRENRQGTMRKSPASRTRIWTRRRHRLIVRMAKGVADHAMVGPVAIVRDAAGHEAKDHAEISRPETGRGVMGQEEMDRGVTGLPVVVAAVRAEDAGATQPRRRNTSSTSSRLIERADKRFGSAPCARWFRTKAVMAMAVLRRHHRSPTASTYSRILVRAVCTVST